MVGLTPEAARIFRITHIKNVPWILENGLHCSSSECRDPNFVQIGKADIIESRQRRAVPIPPGGWLSDYVPFYFTPASPMLLNIITGWEGVKQFPKSQIVVLETSLPALQAAGLPFVFSDRHALPIYTKFSSNLADLAGLPWNLWTTQDFKKDPSHPEKKERYQAEALVHGVVPIAALQGIACHDIEVQAELSKMVQNKAPNLPVHVKPEWYFP